jgi:SAM-dependent methyltransferase
MNIADRARLYREIARVLKPGGTLCIYDVMARGSGGLDFPVPWARTAATSHLMTSEALLDLLEANGFRPLELEDRTSFAIDYLQLGLQTENNAPQPIGAGHPVLGTDAKAKMRNVLNGIRNGCIAPVQVLATRAPH